MRRRTADDPPSPRCLPLQPTPLNAWTIDLPPGGPAAQLVVRTWDADRVAACRLCPPGNCNAEPGRLGVALCSVALAEPIDPSAAATFRRPAAGPGSRRVERRPDAGGEVG